MTNNKLIWTIALLSVLSLCLTAFMLFNQPQTPVVPTAQAIASQVVVPSVNMTGVENRLSNLETQVNKDDLFKASVEKISLTKVLRDKNRDIFNFLNEHNYTVVDREDISSITVKDEKVTSFDTDEGNADVTQELKVYFEDSSGDKHKVYLDVDTSVVKNEADKQVINFH